MLCMDIGCCLEDLPKAMDDRDKWQERVREIYVNSMTWWWWFYAMSFGSPINCIFTFTFFAVIQNDFSLHSPIEYNPFLTRSIWPIDKIITDTITLVQKVPDLQDWNLTIKCRLVSYPGHLFWEVKESYPSARDIVGIF